MVVLQYFLVSIVILGHVFSAPKSDAALDREWYSPASRNSTFVSIWTFDSKSKMVYDWIDESIRAKIETFDADTVEKFASCINNLCALEPTNEEVRQIVMGIMKGTSDYLEVLPRNCSVKITANVPYWVLDPYYRFLAAFQNWKGNDAYLEALMTNRDKAKLFNLSKISGLPLDRPNIYGITPLLAACRYGSYWEVKRILKTKVDQQRRDQLGRTAMHLVAQYCSDPKMMEALILKGQHFDINSQDGHKNTPLHLSFLHLLNEDQMSILSYDGGTSSTGSSKMTNPADTVFEYIVRYSKNLNPNIQNSDGDTVLHLAVKNLDSLLLEKREDLNIAFDLMLNLPFNDVNMLFRQALEKDGCFFGSLTIPFLKNPGTDISKQDRNNHGDTLLHMACRQRNLSAVKAMMKHPNAPVNVGNDFGRTPLHTAYQTPEANAKTGPMLTCDDDVPLVRSSIETLIIEALLQNPETDPNMPNRMDALIHTACRKNDYGTVQTLLRHNRTNVNLRGRDGKPPVQIAYDFEGLRLISKHTLKRHNEKLLDNPSQSILGLLLQNHRVVPDFTIGSDQNTLLHHACEIPNVAAIELLLNNPNTEVNRENALSRTALWIAYDQDNKKSEWKQTGKLGPLTKLLLESPRVDASSPINDWDDTLLHVVCRTGDIQGIQSLLRRQEVKVNAFNANNETPFQIAFRFDQTQEGSHSKTNKQEIGPLTKRFLADPRTDCNVPLDQDGNTIMHILTKYYDPSEYPEAVQFMSQILSLHDVDPNVQNNDGWTPLHYAYQNEKFGLLTNQSPGMLYLLLNHPRTDPNVVIGIPNGSTTLLHLACYQTNLAAVTFLLGLPNIDLMVRDGNDVFVFQLAHDMKHAKRGCTDAELIVNAIFEAGEKRLTEKGLATLTQVIADKIDSEKSKKKKFLFIKSAH